MGMFASEGVWDGLDVWHAYSLLWEILQEKDTVKFLGVDGLRGTGWEDADMPDCCYHGNEPSRAVTWTSLDEAFSF